MRPLTIFALALSFAGIGTILFGTLTHIGIVLLIEGGVLFTLVDENRRRTVGL